MFAFDEFTKKNLAFSIPKIKKSHFNEYIDIPRILKKRNKKALLP